VQRETARPTRRDSSGYRLDHVHILGCRAGIVPSHHEPPRTVAEWAEWGAVVGQLGAVEDLVLVQVANVLQERKRRIVVIVKRAHVVTVLDQCDSPSRRTATYRLAKR
jgi:hypothetical protein